MKTFNWYLLLAICLLSQTLELLAKENSLTHNLTLASDYVFRGESETNNGDITSVQFSTTYTHVNNWYGGIFIANNKFLSAPKVDYVFAPYLGKSGQLKSWGYNVFLFHYRYPNDTPLNYTELWIEIDKQFGASRLKLEITPTLTDWFGVDGWSGVNVAVHPSYQLNSRLAISGAIGHQSLSGDGADGWEHWNLGVNYQFDKVSLDLRYHDSSVDKNHKVYGDPDSLRIFDHRVVLGLSLSF